MNAVLSFLFCHYFDAAVLIIFLNTHVNSCSHLLECQILSSAGPESVVPDGSVASNEVRNGDMDGEEAMETGQFDDADP